MWSVSVSQNQLGIGIPKPNTDGSRYGYTDHIDIKNSTICGISTDLLVLNISSGRVASIDDGVLLLMSVFVGGAGLLRVAVGAVADRRDDSDRISRLAWPAAWPASVSLPHGRTEKEAHWIKSTETPVRSTRANHPLINWARRRC